MGIRTTAAILTARVLSLAGRISGKQGVTLPGKAAYFIDPEILKSLSLKVRKKIIITCGTNGKTTTNNLIASALEAEGKKVICNHTGSNMLMGVIAAFVLSASADGKLDADYAVIEIDEASVVRVLPYMKADIMVITNLFRDQLDRYGEIDITMDYLKKAMDICPSMKIVVNADDSLSYYLASSSGHPIVSYGISEDFRDTSSAGEIREGRFCKRCGSALVYDFYHYGQMGIYHCPNCGFERPSVDYDADKISLKDGLHFDILRKKKSPDTGKKKIFHVDVNYRGFYNIYNILAAYCAVRTAGTRPDHFADMLDHYNPENGRNEAFHIGESDILLNLAKNPAGFNQNISSVMEDKKPKDLIIVINDNAQDGRDISWLWDVDFERLKDPSVRSITVSGIRCRDMRLRLKYVSISAEMTEDVREALEKKISEGCPDIYLLVNYTALYSSHRILKEMASSEKKKSLFKKASSGK